MTATPRPLGFVGSLQDRAAALRRLYTGAALRGLAVHEGSRLVGALGQPPFLTGYVDATGGSAPPRFFKDPDGWVYLSGRAQRDAAQGVGPIFRLPPEYRPPQRAYSLASLTLGLYPSGLVWTNSYEITVDSNGEVIYQHGVGQENQSVPPPLVVSLDPVLFRAV